MHRGVITPRSDEEGDPGNAGTIEEVWRDDGHRAAFELGSAATGDEAEEEWTLYTVPQGRRTPSSMTISCP